MKTLFDSNRDEDILVHIITDGLKPETATLLTELTQHFDRQIDIRTIKSDNLYEFDHPIFKLAPCSVATNYRLMIGKLLPDLQRVLYLDSDLLIRKSIRPIWDTDLGDNVIAGVQEIPIEPSHCTRLGYPIKDGYINAGVILFDLDRYRQLNLDTKLIGNMIANPKRYYYNDQDAINEELHALTKQLPLTYNVTRERYQFKGHHKQTFPGQLQLLRDPAIIHFTNYIKPWHKIIDGNFYLKRKTVERYINMTPVTPGLLNQDPPENRYLKRDTALNLESPNPRLKPARGRERERERERERTSVADRLKIVIAKLLMAVGLYDHIILRNCRRLYDPYPES
jgi:lipopolysaccharide biosynthesis glycosyltransferase